MSVPDGRQVAADVSATEPSYAEVWGTPHPCADHWVAVPFRWRIVRAGDVILAPAAENDDGTPALREPWCITLITEWKGVLTARAIRGTESHAATVDPDDSVELLVPAAELEAMLLLRDELGARVIDRTG